LRRLNKAAGAADAMRTPPTNSISATADVSARDGHQGPVIGAGECAVDLTITLVRSGVDPSDVHATGARSITKAGGFCSPSVRQPPDLTRAARHAVLIGSR